MIRICHGLKRLAPCHGESERLNQAEKRVLRVEPTPVVSMYLSRSVDLYRHHLAALARRRRRQLL